MRPIPLPESFHATIVRSDGESSEVWTDGSAQRIDTIVDGRAIEATISRPDRGLMYHIDIATKTYMEVPIGASERAAMTTNIEDGFEWKRVGETNIDGQCYHEYDVFLTIFGSRPLERILVDPDTGMRKQITTFDKLGQPTLTVEYRNVEIGPQPLDAFELPADFIRTRLAQQ